MNAVQEQVKELVNVELAASNGKFPPFHSAHEGWAVMKEEIMEAGHCFEMANKFSEALFLAIMANDSRESLNNTASIIESEAIDAACEAIQVAAMCRKFQEMGKQDG